MLRQYRERFSFKQRTEEGGAGLLVPAARAALANGVAGHAMDYDDTQHPTSKETI
jgi:2-methylcitrate dehydratase PrpD